MNSIEIHNDNIKVKTVEGIWVDAKEHQKVAFRTFKNAKNPCDGEVDYISDNITIKRIGDKYHGGIHIIEDGVSLPIADWNDVKVFLLDKVGWYNAIVHQTWAYFDFIYSGDAYRKYKSKTGGSSCLLQNKNYIPVQVDYLPPNLVFSLGRDENGTIYYEMNDEYKTRLRISDNEKART